MGKPKKPDIPPEQRLFELQDIMNGLDLDIEYGTPAQSAQAMSEYARIKNQYDQLYTEVYGQSPYADQDGFDPFKPTAGNRTYNEFGVKRQGAVSDKPASGPFTQLGHNKKDTVKAINESRKVFTQEYHNAMMKVIDVGGPMPK